MGYGDPVQVLMLRRQELYKPNCHPSWPQSILLMVGLLGYSVAFSFLICQGKERFMKKVFMVSLGGAGLAIMQIENDNSAQFSARA